MIPKKLHIVWVGDESLTPASNIETWRSNHPDWELKLWGNADLFGTEWVNAEHMREMARREMSGVADMMRWEILHRYGGVAVDADSVCVGTIPDWMLQSQIFAAYENEVLAPGVIAAGTVGAEPGADFIAGLIESIRTSPLNQSANRCVGSIKLTQHHRDAKTDAITVWPSHLFYPEHYSGAKYSGTGMVLAHQQWSSTLDGYAKRTG